MQKEIQDNLRAVHASLNKRTISKELQRNGLKSYSSSKTVLRFSDEVHS